MSRVPNEEVMFGTISVKRRMKNNIFLTRNIEGNFFGWKYERRTTIVTAKKERIKSGIYAPVRIQATVMRMSIPNWISCNATVERDKRYREYAIGKEKRKRVAALVGQLYGKRSGILWEERFRLVYSKIPISARRETITVQVFIVKSSPPFFIRARLYEKITIKKSPAWERRSKIGWYDWPVVRAEIRRDRRSKKITKEKILGTKNCLSRARTKSERSVKRRIGMRISSRT